MIMMTDARLMFDDKLYLHGMTFELIIQPQ